MAHLATLPKGRAALPGLCLAIVAATALLVARPSKAASVLRPVALGHIETAATRGQSDALLTRALSTLMGQVRRRTTLALADETEAVKLRLPEVLEHPVLLWRGEGQAAQLTASEREALKTWLAGGGTLWVDAADGDIAGPFARSVREELERMWPDATLAPLPDNAVLTRSFYLLRGQLGRKAVPTPLRGLMRDGRLAVLLSEGDVLGALAAREDGSFVRPSEGGFQTREMAVRLAINWLMYATCLDYKDDQVHLPFILRRRSL